VNNVDANDGASPWTANHQLREHGNIGPKLVHAAGGRIWSSHCGDLDVAQVAQAHALGLQVLAWKVNEPVPINVMLDRGLGLGGIVSDRPDRLRTAMGQRGRPPPPELLAPP